MFGRSKTGRRTRGVETGGKKTFNYYRSRSRSESGRSPFERQTVKKRFKLGLFFSRSLDVSLLLAIAASLLYSLLVQPHPVLSVDSDIYHPSNVYYQAVQKQLQAVRNRNKITFDQTAIIKNLHAQFPEIADGNIELSLFGEKPKINLHIAEPAFWLASGNQKFIIDNKGTAATLASNLPQITKLATVLDQSGYQADLGRQILSSSSVDFIKTVIAQSQRSGVQLSTLILPTKAQELDLHTKDRSYFVKFYLGGDPLLESGQFLAARHHFDQTGTQPSEYLDVRVSGKIYFK